MDNLSPVCPYCGTQNRPQARHCSGCGAALSPQTPDVPADTPPTETGARKATQCEMVIGFLIPRRCENVALGRCQQCGRSFCDEHLSLTDQGMICVACEQGLDRPVAMAETASTYDSSDMLPFYTATTWGDDDDRWNWDDSDDTFSDLS